MLKMWFLVIVVVGVASYLFYVLRPSSDFSETDNSIDAFIVKDEDSTTEVDQIARNKSKDKYKKPYSVCGKQILILYGTEYGFSEELAKLLFDKISETSSSKECGFPWQPRLVNAKDYQYVDFSKEQICFVVISTSGDGVPPTEARPFYDSLMRQAENLSHLRYSVLALGDSNYPQYCKTGRTVFARFKELNAIPVVGCHDIDMEDWAVINQWMDKILECLSVMETEPRFDYLQIIPSDDVDGFNRHQPFMATMKIKRQLTMVTQPDDRETVHCEFDITGSGLTWTAGDALGIYPQNNPKDIDAILNASGFSPKNIIKTPQWAYQPKRDTVELREALLRYYDLKHVQPALLALISETVGSPQQREMVENLLKNGTGRTNTVLHDYIQEREVIGVLKEFYSAEMGIPEFLSTLRPLQPRYYSISSSPILDSNTVCVTAAVVRYTMLDESRSGVTTTFIQDRLQINHTCPVFMSTNEDFRLPRNHDVSVILIGPGTGIAPFRAFIQERVKAGQKGKTHLYFGCRHRSKDFLYETELEKWNDDGEISLRVAFSRDQDKKIYVQDLLLEDADVVWEAVDQNQAHIYVCGDAKYMAHDVHRTVVRIIQDKGGLSEDAAMMYVKSIENQGRYQKDVWVT